MKLIYAIVSNDDSSMVSSSLTKAGFFATKLASTGGFLKAGNTTFMIATDDEKVDQVIEIISKFSKRRSQMVPTSRCRSAARPSSSPISNASRRYDSFLLRQSAR